MNIYKNSTIFFLSDIMFGMKNPFENDYIGSAGGFREYSDSKRPNIEVLDKKRNEYLEAAISEVMSKLDNKKSIELSDTKVLDNLSQDVLDFLFKFHRVDFNEMLCFDKKIGVREGVAISDLEEVENTYPKELIIKKICEYFSTN